MNSNVLSFDVCQPVVVLKAAFAESREDHNGLIREDIGLRWCILGLASIR